MIVLISSRKRGTIKADIPRWAVKGFRRVGVDIRPALTLRMMEIAIKKANRKSEKMARDIVKARLERVFVFGREGTA